MTEKCGEHEWRWSEIGLGTIRDAEFNEAQAHQAKFTSRCKQLRMMIFQQGRHAYKR